VYPALSIYQATANRFEDVLWVGGEGGMEADLVARQGIPFRAIPAAGVHGVGLRTLPGNIAKLLRGISASERILKEFKPDVLLFTGGYVAVPMAFAGRRIPTLLYVPDIEPGLALKSLAKFADVIALTAGNSKPFFSASRKLVVTGYPVRSDLMRLEKKAALKHFDLSTDLPVLLIVGGSKGARLVNQAVTRRLPELLQKMQVIHLSGELDWAEIETNAKSLPADLQKRYRPFPYLHEEMAAAFSGADVVLSRAGASTLGELPFYGLPAILVPYPFAWRYQKVNADYLVKKGAAVLIENSLLDEQLMPTLSSILDDKTHLDSMKQAMISLAQPGAARNIADLVLKLAERTEKK
jgi:UDP-N-acetylglucosamine--N-acetylmuramyl-(pentapeptide) pyrophosphoryl-undecaprenol N-acetylglucosamine transferase